MSEPQADYLTDAMVMAGAGYDRPSVEIEAPRLVIERRNRQMVETESPAFVKISTGFKSELKDLDPTALKVWLYIALSINRVSETAYPGLRKIATDTNLAINTVRDAVDRLENNYDLLSVTRHGTKRTIYRVTDFVSANHKEPVSKTDTHAQTVSVEYETVSVKAQTVSVAPVKSAQPDLTRQPELSAASKKKIIQSANKTVDGILLAEKQSTGKSWTNLPANYHEYGKAFCDATGLSYHKKYLMDWIATFDEWESDGFTPEQVTAAVSACRTKGMDISRPGSITWKLRAQKVSTPYQVSMGAL